MIFDARHNFRPCFVARACLLLLLALAPSCSAGRHDTGGPEGEDESSAVGDARGDGGIPGGDVASGQEVPRDTLGGLDESAPDSVRTIYELRGEEMGRTEDAHGAPADVVLPPTCAEFADTPEPAIRGMLYLDNDTSSTTMYSQGFFPLHDEPLPGLDVRLVGQTGEYSATTCSTGDFAFGDLTDGTYLVDVKVDEGADCTSTNRASRLPVAVLEGQVALVTIGDSIAVVGSHPLFHDTVAAMLSPLADIENINVAVSGSRATDWVPGKYLFENELAPLLPHADVVLVTLGGNDLMAWLGGSFYDYNAMAQKFAQFPEFLDTLHADIVSILSEIRKRDPMVDIVFCLYFNYAYATYWQKFAGPWLALVLQMSQGALDAARKNLSQIPGILIADMPGAMKDTKLDPYLSDSVHLSAKGHQVYAEQIFMVLGGARVSLSSLGLNRLYGFDPTTLPTRK